MGENLQTELKALKEYVLKCPYNAQLDMFLDHEFETYSQKDLLGKDVYIALMKSITGQISSKNLKNYLSKSSLTQAWIL